MPTLPKYSVYCYVLVDQACMRRPEPVDAHLSRAFLKSSVPRMAEGVVYVQIKIAGHLLWQPRDMNGPGKELLAEAGEEAGSGQR